MDYGVKITYKDGSNMPRSKMAKWLYDNRGYRQLGLLDSLSLTDNLIDGMIWSPEYYSIDIKKFQCCEFLNVELIETLNEFELIQIEYEKVEALRVAGASGDVEAALAFCKLDIAKIYSRLGIAYAG